MSDKQQSAPAHVLRRQARELEEQRILGLAPLAVDSVTGNSISPHVPSMLSTAPWYRKDLQKAGLSGDRESNMTIAHHLEGSDLTGSRDVVLPESNIVIFEKSEAKERTGVASSLLPKDALGACRNCGAVTHRTENCLRPRRKISGSNEGAGSSLFASAKQPTAKYDQSKSAFQRSWDACEKRAREEESSELNKAGPRTEGATLFDARTTAEGLKVANHDLSSLPKYLENLDDGTFYDPRTRSMRGNPNANKKGDPSAATSVFKGDNATLHTSGYYDYLDEQARYLAGDSKSFAEVERAGALRVQAIAKKADDLARKLLKLYTSQVANSAADTHDPCAGVLDALYVDGAPASLGIPSASPENGGETVNSVCEEDEFCI